MQTPTNMHKQKIDLELTKQVKEAAAKLGITRSSIHERIRNGLNPEDALSIPKFDPKLRRRDLTKETFPFIQVLKVHQPKHKYWGQRWLVKCNLCGKEFVRNADTILKKTARCPCRGNPKAKYITYNGKTFSITGWAHHLGLNLGTFKSRLKSKMSEEQIFSRDTFTKKPIILSFNGKSKTVRKWSVEWGVSRQTIYDRLRRGITTLEQLSRIPAISGPLYTADSLERKKMGWKRYWEVFTSSDSQKRQKDG
ncbi:MAG: hypothetical protein HQL72_12180 [Magnetococcales bacterium]|nr:hypothetical protein [Magnetococcales bacterium]